MNVFRKLFAVLTAASLCAVCSSCAFFAPTDNKVSSENRTQIVTTIFPAYDFARQITGEYADVSMLVKPGTEIHNYEPTPADIIKIGKCDVFICIGGESEEWVNGIIETSENENMRVVRLMDAVSAREEEVVDGMQTDAEHEHDEDETEYDEHIWTSPKNAKLMVRNISEAVIASDPDNGDKIQKATDEYIKNLENLDRTFSNIAGSAKRREIVFADRFPFLYFAKEYGLEYHAAFSGCGSDVEASASTVAFLIDLIKKDSIPAVFYIDLSNQKLADTVSEETGAKKLLFHSCQNVSADEMKSGETYLSLMEKNAVNLREALN